MITIKLISVSTNPDYDTDMSEYQIEFAEDPKRRTYLLKKVNNLRSDWTDIALNKEERAIKDHGNGVTIKGFYKKNIDLSYSEIHDLYLLLKVYHKEEKQNINLAEVKKYD